LIPFAENDSESDAEYDSEDEDRADAAKKKMKVNPDFAEADHCHAPVTRYARHLIRVLNRGWLLALLCKGKVFKGLAHFLFSFTPPKDANASCVRGLADAFQTSGPVQWKHHICHIEDAAHGDTPYPPQVNLVGFTKEQAKLWLETHPPWIVLEPLREYPGRTYRSRRRTC
jgi:hypothetical protein